MKSRLRLALPPLALVAPDAVAAFALFDRKGLLLRSGQMPLNQLAQAVPADQVQAVLHPGDAIVVTLSLPPLPAKRLDAAVQASVEPMALSDVSDLCIAHGPRAADGSLCAAWAEKRTLLQAWQTLAGLGLKVTALVPFDLAVPVQEARREQALGLPADERWQFPLPRWSLARSEWRPVSQGKRWHSPLLWLGAAALLWLVGLQIHAAQLRAEADALQASTESAVRKAFPAIPIVIDPVKQARGQRDMLRLDSGTAADDGFMPLALSAAQILDFTEGHVLALQYENGDLTLVLTEGYTPPSNEAALHQAAAARSLVLEKDDDTPHTWRIRHAGTPPASKVRP